MGKRDLTWYYPDAIPGESESDYFARKEDEEQSSEGTADLFGGLISLVFYFAKIAAIFGLFLFTAYRLSDKLLGSEADKLKIWGLTFLFIYLLFCVIFFLKGIIIVLRAKQNKLWILPWSICVLLCCVLPAYMIKSFVTAMFPLTERESFWSVLLSWGAFVFSVLYIYDIYQFKTPNAPRIFKWIFILGFKAGR